MEWNKHNIRKQLQSLIRQRQYQMDNGFVEKSLKRYKAISYLKRRLDFFSQSSTTAHLRLVLSAEDEIRNLMPGIRSKFEKERLKIIDMIEYARRKVNSNRKRVAG